MYLSRLILKRSPDIAALGQLLDPVHNGKRMDAHHRLVWSAFAGDPSARRDFLWRDMGRGAFLVLSQRLPGASALFDLPETQDFVPDLAPGDQLVFALRANATRTVIGPDGRKRHHDVVMDALRDVPTGSRAAQRLEVAQVAGRRWLDGQGIRAGFVVRAANASAYDVAETRRGGPRFGILDLEGTVEVHEPAVFLTRLSQGFGRAKSFGCGLMLIRRA